MKIIKIPYAELAACTRNIYGFIATNYWGKEIKPSTSITEDLGIDGDDAYELLEKFADTYKVDFSTFKGEEYIVPEGGSNPLVLLYIALLIVIVFTKYLLWCITFLFNRKQFHKINKFDCVKRFNSLFKNDLKDLTVGDLITSAILGKFTERKEVKYVII